jgi:GH25 family lysozyme M1 (1,4-beta-N-acetylmuramidase)
MSTVHKPSTTTQLAAAQKTETKDLAALKTNVGQEKKVNQTFREVEKLMPPLKDVFEQGRAAEDARLSAQRRGLQTQIAAEKKTIATLEKETKKFSPGSFKKGPGSLRGADTSMWEGGATFGQSIKGAQWSAIKASEGTGFVDPTFKSRWNELGKRIQQGKMKLRVAYQFMHAGDGVAQAKHFLNTVGVHGKLQAGTRLALDWEAGALSDPGALHDAARYIHKVTGVWPLVYVQGSEMSRAKAAVPQAPIWEAAWGGSVNRNVPFVQYGDGPGYDHDVFNGNLTSLERFAGWA